MELRTGSGLDIRGDGFRSIPGWNVFHLISEYTTLGLSVIFDCICVQYYRVCVVAAVVSCVVWKVQVVGERQDREVVQMVSLRRHPFLRVNSS